MTTYEQLISGLDAFIRKYYANRLLRGTLIFTACLLAYFLLINIGEYYFYFPAWLKMIIISILFVAGIFSLIVWIVIPFMKMQRLGKTITHEQAAGIIGRHFPQVSDKLLNILQLKNAATTGNESRELITAAIDQKAQSLKLVPFVKAVDFSKNKKYLPFLLAPLLVILFILLASPNIFRDASGRLMQADKNFSPPAPFTFSVINKSFKVGLYDNYTLNVKVSGKQLPENVSVVVEGAAIPMQRSDKSHFNYTFRHVAKDLDFYLSAAGFSSEAYKLSIIQKPQLNGFKVWISYPPYTGKQNEVLQSLSDLSVPQGTTLKWAIETKNTDHAFFRLGTAGQQTPMTAEDKNVFSTQYRFLRDTAYTFFIANRQMPQADSFSYRIQVIPDLSPQVQLQEMKDSISGEQVVLTGTASDDYGLSRLYFHYSVLDEQHKETAQKDVPLTITKGNGNVSPYQFYFDFATLDLQPGQEVNYYVEAWDNDAVNGSKSARSAIMTYKPFGGRQIDSAINQTSQQIAQGLNNSASQSEQLEQEMKDLKSQLLQSESMDWQQSEKMKALMDKQMQLKGQVEAIKKRFDAQQKQTEQKNYSDAIKQKQEAIDKQLDNLANKELAEQLKKLQDLMQKMNKDNAFQNLQQMQEQNKLFNMDLERIQELMKQLEMQMKMEDMANKLQQLAKDQNGLQQKTDAQRQSNQQLSQEQKDLKKQLDELMREDMKALEQKNNEQSSDNKQDLGKVKDAGKDAQNNMQQSGDQLQQNQSSQSSQSQQQAQQDMQQMMQELQQMASGMDMEQINIDIKATRQILTNLLRFSFNQEALMNKTRQTSPASTLYTQNARGQKQLADNARMIKDSLFALSKRVYQLSAGINKETTDLTTALDKAIQSMEARSIPQALVQQQYSMTSANNLALLLNETLSNLMQMQAQAMQMGKGQSGKGQPQPGQGAPSPGQMMQDIITGQQQMGKGMQQMQGQGKQGKDGNQNGQGRQDGGSEGSAEQLARLAQQQAALRRQIQELNSLLNSKGIGGNAQLIKEIQQQMDKQETDLVNRRETSELVKRQQAIMTRLLQAEKSIREQEEDNKRSSTSGKDVQRSMPPELQQYLQSRQALLDFYKTTPPPLKPYYKKMAEEYLDKVKQ